jgi:hypothetical protein
MSEEKLGSKIDKRHEKVYRRIARVYEKLKEGPASAKELADKLKNDSAFVKIRSVEREVYSILNILKKIEVVEKGKDGKYRVVERKTISKDEAMHAQELSYFRKLIPFIKMIAGIKLNDEDARIWRSIPDDLKELHEEEAKRYLESKEEVRKLLAECEKLKEEIKSKKEEFRRRIEERLKDRFGESKADKAKLFFYRCGIEEMHEVIYRKSKGVCSVTNFMINDMLLLNGELVAKEQLDPSENRSEYIPLRGGSLSELREFVEEQIADKSNIDLVGKIIEDEESLSKCERELREKVYIIIEREWSAEFL